jgi:hypothetical protein
MNFSKHQLIGVLKRPLSNSAAEWLMAMLKETPDRTSDGFRDVFLEEYKYGYMNKDANTQLINIFQTADVTLQQFHNKIYLLHMQIDTKTSWAKIVDSVREKEVLQPKI